MIQEPLLSDNAESTINTLFQALGFALLCVLCVGVGAVLIIRRLTQGSFLRGPRNQRLLKIVDSVPLGGRRALTVARIHNSLLVLGVGPDNIQLLVEITEEDRETPAVHDFARELRREKLMAAHEIET
ncbi:MAG: flagellar biosynthetic protein FliO [Planctomycetota bacterium]